MVADDIQADVQDCKLVLPPDTAQALGWLLIKHGIQAVVPRASQDDLEMIAEQTRQCDDHLSTFKAAGDFLVMQWAVSDDD